MTLAIELSEVQREFRSGLTRKRSHVLRGIDLTLAEGRTLGLVGPNGSGKTTLLRLVAGVDEPSAGRVTVLGASPLAGATRKRIGYLPEDSPFPRELTAHAALDLLGSLQGMPKQARRARAAKLVELVGLTASARTVLGRYSRGMLRRFGLAQAWLCDPELVLLDEPTAGLDAQGYGVLAELLTRARQRKSTVVIASHVAFDLTEHCDELAVILDGRIAAHGEPGTLLGVDGRTELELTGLDAEGLGQLRAWVGEHGGRVTAERPGVRGLLELYKSAGGAAP